MLVKISNTEDAPSNKFNININNLRLMTSKVAMKGTKLIFVPFMKERNNS